MSAQPTRRYYHTRHQAQQNRDLHGNPSTPTFMGLSVELREVIYMFTFKPLKFQSCSMLVCFPKVFANTPENDKKNLSILRVNKQIY